ncbi:hypothetical protein F0562_025699 [Nyssa sinensis]|uniref:Uncharacterized protein n=1 Tax=Nyssa sinensis TaxID=561372 RepID=A0A5J5BB72_9ASTE|nr:hypothetical protein F0562_025699 [Nyssa sinensis]
MDLGLKGLIGFLSRSVAAARSEIDLVAGVDVEAGFDDGAVGYDRRAHSFQPPRTAHRARVLQRRTHFTDAATPRGPSRAPMFCHRRSSQI